MKVWGHSHVKMATSPSGQDEKQFEELAKNSDDFFIRIITNKTGSLRLDFWDKTTNVTYNCVQWLEERQKLINDEAIKKEINEKVSKITYTQTKYTPNSNYANKYYDYETKSYKDLYPSKKKEEKMPSQEELVDTLYDNTLYDNTLYGEDDMEYDGMFYYYEDAKMLMADFGLGYDEVFEMADMSAIQLKNEFEQQYLGLNEEMSMLEAEYVLRLLKNHIYEQQ